MAGDDCFALTASDGAENMAGGFFSGHDEPGGDGFLGRVMEGAAIVDVTDVTGDEARADESNFDAGEGEFGSIGIGESTDSELAHGIRPEARNCRWRGFSGRGDRVVPFSAQ